MGSIQRGTGPTLFFLLATTSCGGGAEISVDELRSEVLSRIASDVILPHLRRMDETGQALAQAIETLVLVPGEDEVLAAQDAWRAARAAWNRAEAVIVGPPQERLLPEQVDTSPIDAVRIEQVISGGLPIHVTLVEQLGATQKGFHAIEYLLFDPSQGTLPIVASLAVDSNAPRRAAFLLALARELSRVLAEMRALWEPTGGDFVTEFTTAGRGSGVFATRKEALDLLLNHMITVVETLADQRLGRPLGRTSGGLGQPPGAECSRSGNSRLDALNDALGLRDLYTGAEDGTRASGLTALVGILQGEIDLVLLDGCRALVTAIEAIPETLVESAMSDPAAVESAFDLAKDLKARFVADLAGALGGTLTFSPNDGD